MTTTEIVLVIVLLLNFPLAAVWAAWLVGREEEMWNRRVANYESRLEDEAARVDRLLDRIQEPDIERREAILRPEPLQAPVERIYDETGLASVEVLPEDAE